MLNTSIPKGMLLLSHRLHGSNREIRSVRRAQGGCFPKGGATYGTNWERHVLDQGVPQGVLYSIPGYAVMGYAIKLSPAMIAIVAVIITVPTLQAPTTNRVAPVFNASVQLSWR